MPHITDTQPKDILIKTLETLKVSPNEKLTTSSTANFDNCENLISVDMTACQFVNCGLPSFVSCQELATIIATNSTGLNIGQPIEATWSHLTKLSTIKIDGAGLNVLAIDTLIKWLSEQANIGMGAAILTAKTILLNGQNARVTVTDAAVLAAKNNLIAKGWTVTHN